MKNLKLVVLLLVFSPLVMAQAPQSEQVLTIKQPEEISFSALNNNLNRVLPDVVFRNSTEIQIQNYLQQEGINSISELEDTPMSIESLNAEDLLSKGTLNADLQSMFGFYFNKNKYDGNDNGNTNGRLVNIRGGGNFADGWGVRGSVLLNGQTYKPESGGGKDKYRNNLVKIEVVKPIQVGAHVINIFAGGGIGVNKSIQEFNGMENENKDDITCFGGGVELPVNLAGSASYINPMLHYSSTKWNWDNGEDTYNAIGLGAAMYSFFNCAMFDPCNKDGLNLAEGNYSLGNIWVGSNTGFNVEFGSETIKYDFSSDVETNNMHTGLNFEIGYYVTEGLSVVALLDYEGESIDDKDSDNKVTETCIWGGLGLTYQLPLEGKAQHIYAHANYQTGKEKNKIEGSGSTIKNDQDENQFTIGVGYNLFVVKGIALTPELNYITYTEDDGTETNTNGFYIGVGLKTFLPKVF